MSKRRDRSEKLIKPTRARATRFVSKTVTGQTWFTKLPRWARYTTLLALAVPAVLLVLAAMPALVLVALCAERAVPVKGSNAPGAAAIAGFALVLLAATVSSGASLVEVARTGEFCMGSSSAGLVCTTFEQAPVLYSALIVVFWVIFWLCATFVVAAVRELFSQAPHDA